MTLLVSRSLRIPLFFLNLIRITPSYPYLLSCTLSSQPLPLSPSSSSLFFFPSRNSSDSRGLADPAADGPPASGGMRLVAPAHAQPSLLLRTGGSRRLFSSPPPGAFASLSVRDGGEALKLDENERPVAAVAEGSGKKGKLPPMEQLLRYPLAMLALVPNSVALFAAGAGAGAVAKILTAPLDRVKLLMQTHSVRVVGESTKRGVGFLEGAWCNGGRIHLEEA